MVRPMKAMHLSYVKISTISKWNKTSFQLSLVTKEYHWVNYGTFGANRAPILHRHNTVSKPTETRFGCIQNDFRDYSTLAASHAPI
jgi:hypothetical protein